MNNSDDYYYSESHVWLEEQSTGLYTLGITEHAQNSLGDIVFVELPSEGQQFAAGEGCAVIESVKSASDVIMPISGEIIAINQQLVDMPELLIKNLLIMVGLCGFVPRLQLMKLQQS